jgi:hypothetical protein
MSTDDSQLDLPLRAVRRATPEQIEAAALDLVAMLSAGPLTCRQIEARRPDWARDDGRYVRLIARASGRVLSAPGSRGYALQEDVDDHTLDKLIGMLIAQVKAMGREIARLRRLRGLRKATATLLQP